jgi:hypothetical protein
VSRAAELACAALVVLACGKKPETPPRRDAAPSVADAAPADPGRPSRAECELAVSHMQALAPELVPGDADDLAECLKLPRALVLCVQTAKSNAEADACVERAAGDTPRPPHVSADQCRQVAAHYAQLVPASERDETTEASMLAACTRQLTPEDAGCVLAARTRADADACLGGG